MILKAKHHPLIYPFFRAYAIFCIRRRFRNVRIIGEFSDKHLPLLLIANHFSWWDGFTASYLNSLLFRRKFHFMMLEDQLRKYWFFNHTGGFSVNKKSMSIRETIQYTRELLSDNKNMVLMFPQGEIQSMHRQNFVFEKGIERILLDLNHPVEIVFLATLVDYFSGPKPGIHMYLTSYNQPESDCKSLQHSYNEFFQECIAKQLKLAE